jgi:uncharacterized RDD family membrane protein YckC
MLEQQQTTLRLADFGERFVAYLVDGVIGAFVGFLIGALFQSQGASALVSLVFGVVYTVGFWSYMGATPGKQLMGLRVVKREDGAFVDIGTGILRYIGYILSSIPLFLGFFWAIWDENNETWHDKIAGTRVVKAR